MFDRWMIAHFLGWAAIAGWLTWFLDGPYPGVVFPLVAAGTVVWEVVESVREHVLGHDPETTIDRWAIDPVANFAGAGAGYLFAVHVII